MNPHRTRNHGSIEHRESIKRMLDKTKKDNRVKVLRGKLQKVALNLTENVKYNMTNFMKRPSKQKTRFERELYGDMLATNSKDKMQLLTNLESTRDDKILERDEDGDIVNSLGDTRGTALVHSFSEENPHGIVSPIDKGEQEYQQTKALIKTTADGKPPRMTQERATRTLENIEKGNARKGVSINPTYKFKVSKLKGKLQKMAAVGLPDNFGKDPEEYSSYSDFLDKFQKGEKPDLKPSKYPLPKYFEEDYEAFHDKVQDIAFRFEDASDAGIDIENKENENQLQGNWGDLSETNKGSLRNHYQKQLSKELSWQKDPKLYTSGKLPESQQTYAQPGFNKNLVLDEVDPKEGYATINPNDIKPKFPKQYDDPSKYSKLKGRLQKLATDINRSPVNNTMSKSDEIINSFGNSGLSIEGVDGVYDTDNHKILDANNSDDVERLRGLYGKDKYIGTNSETDTRDGPNTNDLERTRKELQAIEDKGGVPALGFDSAEGGSLEALNVSVVNSKEEVLQALNKNQWGTGILHPNGKFEIVKSLKYIGRNK